MSEDNKPRDRTVSFNQYLDKKVIVSFNMSRSFTGIIKGWDSLNLILQDAVETRSMTNEQGEQILYTRELGECLVRLSVICSIMPEDGYEPLILNPEPQTE